MIDKVIHLRTGREVSHVQLTKENAQAVADWTQGYLVEERDSLTGEPFVGLNMPTGNGNTVRVSEGMHITQHFLTKFEWTQASFDRLFAPIHEEVPMDDELPRIIKPSTGFADG